ncbi:hypothetical protein [Blastococcus sp. VKM Ac-2987]|uniref:hypothetical protein n=1 Tax=Blastococcus sp. VKM Ac-2987 TaxID=3004141 RepID=UPI0022AB7E34|nr:hypothetical protein [Blastococcus sp. VKM Ac-2987]MCZ2857303.1 hypothetical protein [Blastococcus sp. VKM Ac-2987]
MAGGAVGTLVLLDGGCRALLAAYVELSGSFGVGYGPLTGVIALLLWTQLTSVALFLGCAVSALLEAGHVGIDRGAEPDRDRPAG